MNIFTLERSISASTAGNDLATTMSRRVESSPGLQRALCSVVDARVRNSSKEKRAKALNNIDTALKGRQLNKCWQLHLKVLQALEGFTSSAKKDSTVYRGLPLGRRL
jgi:hypothetical protein